MKARRLAVTVAREGALPVPVAPEPQPPTVERLAEIEARADAATAGPWCTDAWEIYQGTEYVPGISFWIGETCRGTSELGQDRADAAFVAAARSDVPELVAEVRRQAARIAELESERHSTNEALDDAVQALRTDRERFETARALCDAADYAGITSGGWFTVEAIRKALGIAAPGPGPDAVTTVFAERAAAETDPGRRTAWRMLAQDVMDGEHYGSVHHDYRPGLG
ncbi:hypothetical protein, partial [Streptomyces europaeiscabiei]